MRDGHFARRIGSRLYQHRNIQPREPQGIRNGALVAKVGQRYDHAVNLIAMRPKQVRAAPRVGVGFHRSEFALLRGQAERLVPLLAKHPQDLFTAIARQHVGKKTTIPDDYAEPAHKTLRGRNLWMYTPPSSTISPPHHTGACRLANTVEGRSFHSAIPLARIRAP